MVRGCFRCGAEFEGEGRGRVCAACRKPRILKRGREDGPISFRENQIVALVAHAHSNKEIAFLLHLTEGTIKEYLNRIYRKTGCRNRTALALWYVAQRSGDVVQ
jgi:DNA-binding NarL/FixJ family response regulator